MDGELREQKFTRGSFHGQLPQPTWTTPRPCHKVTLDRDVPVLDAVQVLSQVFDPYDPTAYAKGMQADYH